MKMKNLRGFTIIELMIVVAVAGVLAAIGIPMFNDIIKNNRLTTQINDLVSTIHLAKNEAITRGHNVRIESINGDEDWSNGWQVRLDVDSDGDYTDAADEVIRVYSAVEGSDLQMTPTDETDDIVIEDSGFAEAARTLTLTANSCTGQHIRVMTMTRAGSTSVTKQDCP